jgi:NitT/TauT family transport system permease protein
MISTQERFFAMRLMNRGAAMRNFTHFAGKCRVRARLRWMDFLILGAVMLLVWAVGRLGADMFARVDSSRKALDTSFGNTLYCSGRTVLRMWIAFGFSLAFALGVGYAAARNSSARAILLPLLDVLQSVPVLGFLSAAVPFLGRLFAGSPLGMECASIFAIFTGQTWNLCFAFYQSLRGIPSDLEDASRVCHLGAWRKFTVLELPSAANNLAWNAMLSFGGGWFFVVQSEAITVMGRQIELPGLGSMMAASIERADTAGALNATAAMLLVVLLTDQLVWRPLLDWSERFKLEPATGAAVSRSFVFRLLQSSRLLGWFKALFGGGLAACEQRFREGFRSPVISRAWAVAMGLCRLGMVLVGMGFIILAGDAMAAVAPFVLGEIDGVDWGRTLWLSVLTLLRVLLMTLVASVLWVPLAVVVGQSKPATRTLQPFFEMAASFPVNMAFPFVIGWFVAHRIPMDWGAVLLLALGAQWYILFNVTGAAASLPFDLSEVARGYGLRGFNRWRILLLPSIFPAWVTGASTAAGAAWNASIVAELATWGSTTLEAKGLGSLIARAAERGRYGELIAGVGVMSVLVVLTNKLLWRPLYALAERRFGMG